ncbi:hypothetical protein [Rhizobium sp. NXC14]|uniref:hypothetical protein n=1 Tax=Rhizobium sp. NXC14 TaxID=1981173 RepID=UPI0012F52569|nr:hypothetical protein [Rhizobium sp. NXC14]
MPNINIEAESHLGAFPAAAANAGKMKHHHISCPRTTHPGDACRTCRKKILQNLRGQKAVDPPLQKSKPAAGSHDANWPHVATTRRPSFATDHKSPPPRLSAQEIICAISLVDIGLNSPHCGTTS